MKTIIKIVLLIALITALCGCTEKADTLATKKETTTPTQAVNKDISTEIVNTSRMTMDADEVDPNNATNTSLEVDPDKTIPDANASATQKPTAIAEAETTPVPETSDKDGGNDSETPTPNPTTAPTTAPVAETLAKPTISISPKDTTRDPITVTITAPAEATMVKYKIDNLGYSVYSGSFTVSGNCKITAYAATHTAMSEYATKSITNFDSSPEPTPELTVSSAGSSYMKAVANAINAAKEAAGKPTASVSYGGQIQSDAENILLGVQSGPSGQANMVRGNYSGTGAGNALAGGVLMDASNINIGAAKSSTGEYCVCVAYW